MAGTRSEAGACQKTNGQENQTQHLSRGQARSWFSGQSSGLRAPSRSSCGCIGPAPCSLPPCTLHPAPCTLHPAPCTLHPAPCTLHPEPCTLHPAPLHQILRCLAGLMRAPLPWCGQVQAGRGDADGPDPLTLSLALTHSHTFSCSLTHTHSLAHSHTHTQVQAGRGDADGPGEVLGACGGPAAGTISLWT